MKRPIEKILIILNVLIGLMFIGSVIISKIPLLNMNILDKYLNFSFSNGLILILAYVLAGLYLIMSIVLISNRPKFTNNSIYVYGNGTAKVTSHDIKKIAKSVLKETEGVKSFKIEIELGEFGNCLAVYMKIEDGYDFQSLVPKIRLELEEAITENLGIKFPSYKYADGEVLFEFGAPYAGVGIDLETSQHKVQSSNIDAEKEDTSEILLEEPYNNSAQKVIEDDVYPEVDFVPEQIDVIEEKSVTNEIEQHLEPDQYSIPYATPNRKMGVRMEQEAYDTKAQTAQFKPFEQNEYDDQTKQAPFQAAYENINRELQKQATSPTNPFEAREFTRSEKAVPPQSQPQVPRQSPPNVQRPIQQQPVQNYEQQPRVAQQGGHSAFRRPYPQRPIGVRPTPQSSNTSINPAASAGQQHSNVGNRPPQRPAGSSRISKEDIYARINAILNKYSNLDDENNK